VHQHRVQRQAEEASRPVHPHESSLADCRVDENADAFA
jgi:hypothetical protein